jgi:hypothetical protein
MIALVFIQYDMLIQDLQILSLASSRKTLAARPSRVIHLGIFVDQLKSQCLTIAMLKPSTDIVSNVTKQ